MNAEKRRFQSLLLVALLASSYPAYGQRIEFAQVDRAAVERRLGEAPVKDRDRKDRLVKLFEAAGCSEERLTEQAVKRQRLPNVVCTLPGSTDSTILIGAHFDHVDIGKGVADNWSGASLLPTLYQSLASGPRKHTFVFVGFTAEEQGLVGSAFFAKQMTAEHVAKTKAIINIDTLGLSSTKVWSSHSDKQLLQALGVVANSMKLPLAGVNVEQVGSSDSESFARLKIPRIAIHSVTQETFPILHSQKDNIAAINLADYYDSYRLIAAYLAYLDGLLEVTSDK